MVITMYEIMSSKNENDIFEIVANGMCEKSETTEIMYERRICATEDKIVPKNGTHESSATSAVKNITSGMTGRIKIFAINEMSERLPV